MPKDILTVYSVGNLKTKEEYLMELVNIRSELELGLATDTLIKDDLKLLTRLDEIMVILIYMETHKLV